MSESEETKWRLGNVEPGETEERAAELSSEEDEQKEELQETVQSKADEIGGGGEGSIIPEPAEEPTIEVPKKKERKTKAPTLKKREPEASKSIVKQIERQANQLTRMEKAIVSLQKSVNKMDKQSNTIKQLYVAITQLQRQVLSTKNRKQNQGPQKKKAGKNSSKKRRLKGRR
jgi:hypothetical protein